MRRSLRSVLARSARYSAGVKASARYSAGVKASAVSVLLVALSACTTGDVAVGETNKAGQELKRRADGGATGNGSTCSWDGTIGYTTSNAAGRGSYAVGATFDALDGCNECSCTAQGIMCTMRACEGPKACSQEAMACPDGSYVSRTGPSCEFAPCPGGKICPNDVKKCPDGSTSVRSGPSCEFTACPTPVACTDEAKLCPDGSSVGRIGPNCEFAACPVACAFADCGPPPPVVAPYLCSDGVTWAGGVKCERTNGQCGFVFPSCPAPCTKEECGPAMGMPNYLCPDGVTTAGPMCTRTNGKCGYTVVSCPTDGGGGCTGDAKRCPDGSFVSRTMPGCQFAPCP